MFYKIARQARFSGVRNIQIIRNASKIPKSTDNRAAEREIDEGLKIEASLFGNSTLEHKPALAQEVLQRMRPTSSGQQLTNRNSFVKREPISRQSKIIDDPQLGLSFVRLNLHDPQLHTLLTTARSRKRRDKDSQIVVEGRRLIQEALECRMNMRALIFSQTDQLQLIKETVAQAQRTTQSKIYKVPQHDLKTWSTLRTPPGLMAIFERPSQKSIVQHLTSSRSPAMPISVVCDNIREPNNLGSIIRTCAAIPCMQVIVTRGCCDPWESKALRGGCGGHFRVPIRDNVDWSELPLLIPADTADDCCVFVAENNLDKLQDKTMALEYANLERVGSHNVLVIGGESHGVSSDAYRFLETVGKKGKCLYIPLAEGVDSLNVASALTLMLYELRKHLQKSEIVDV